MEYRLPVKVSKLRKYVNALALAREEFDRDDAIIDLMLALDRGDLKPYRYYAKRWRWKESTTYKRWKPLLCEVEEWRTFDTDNNGLQKVSKKEAKSKQRVSKKRPKESRNGSQVSTKEAQSKQEVSSIEHTTYLHTTNNISDTNVSSPVSGENGMTSNQIMESWNAFAQTIGSPTIRILSDKRKEWIRLRKKKIVPLLDEIYAAIKREPFLIGGVPGKEYHITFDYLWRNSHNYVKILEGGHWTKPQAAQNGHAAPPPRNASYRPWEPADIDHNLLFENP